MNKERRNKLKQSTILLKEALQIIENVKNDEEDAFDNLSEGLQQTMRGEEMEDNISTLDDISDMLTKAIDDINCI